MVSVVGTSFKLRETSLSKPSSVLRLICMEVMPMLLKVPLGVMTVKVDFLK